MANPQLDPQLVWNAQTLIDQAPIGIARTTVGGDLLYANAALAHLLEFESPAAMRREGVAIRYKNPTDRAALIDLLHCTHTVQDQEITIITRTGAERVVLASLTLEDEILSSMLVDITERKHIAVDQQRSTARLQVLADASHAFAAIGQDYQALLDHVVRHVCEVLADMCQIRLLSDDGEWLKIAAIYSLNPELAQSLRALTYHVAERVSDPRLAPHVFRSGEPILVPVITRDQLQAIIPPELWSAYGQFPPHSSIVVALRVHGRSLGVMSLIRYQSGQPAYTKDDLALAQDIAERAAMAISNAQLFVQAERELAERKRAEQALESERALLTRRVAERTADLSLANAELARAARLKDEFLANMSHELRTPLNAILGRTEAIEEEIYGSVTAKQVEVLHGIAESGRHLLTLINDILDISKIEAGRLEMEYDLLDIDLLCTASLHMITETAMVKRISIRSDLSGMVRTISADERRMKQILVNLLSNAVKFTPEGGEVGLEVRGDTEQQTATFSVWDTGIGIAADDLPKLFQPFVQIDSSLSRQYTGSGLGLALVRRLAAAHGGSMSVESTPGQGSRFSVTLPWIPEAHAADGTPATARIHAATPAVSQALVIEDSATTADQLARYLRELGTRVEIHPFGAGTVERTITLQPDVIILDILLPDESGWDVLCRLKAEPRTQAIPVVIISVVDEPARARELGAAAMICKPIDRATLAHVLHRVAARLVEPPVNLALIVAPYEQRPRILLAEDNEANIDVMFDYLMAKGYAVTMARNGNEALLRAEEVRPEVILMDIQMPGIDGLEAIRRLRNNPNLRTIAIIAVTALAMPGDRDRCLAAGADEYLTKPVNLRTLVTMIEAQRRGRD
ncbi:MAG: response regulator [Chloroflexales bacterium]